MDTYIYIYFLNLLPDIPFSAVSCMSSTCRRHTGRFSVNMSMTSSIVFADTLDVLMATFAV